MFADIFVAFHACVILCHFRQVDVDYLSFDSCFQALLAVSFKKWRINHKSFLQALVGREYYNGRC